MYNAPNKHLRYLSFQSPTWYHIPITTINFWGFNHVTCQTAIAVPVAHFSSSSLPSHMHRQSCNGSQGGRAPLGGCSSQWWNGGQREPQTVESWLGLIVMKDRFNVFFLNLVEWMNCQRKWCTYKCIFYIYTCIDRQIGASPWPI